MKYRTIVADPPWRYTQNPPAKTGSGVSAEHQYPTMTTDAIAALPVAAMADDDAHLPGPYLELFARRRRYGWDVWGNEAPEEAASQAVLGLETA